MKRKATKIS